jgi:hypothetical protein
MIFSSHTNPILADARRSGMNAWGTVLGRFNAAVGYGAFITADYERITDPDDIAHARRVLERLARS